MIGILTFCRNPKSQRRLTEHLIQESGMLDQIIEQFRPAGGGREAAQQNPNLNKKICV